jgi:ribosomal protein S18 acetylase RimI-like enzyme
MTEISVHVLDEGDWAQYRDVRLAALKESPEAFVATYEEEAALDEEGWRERMRRSRRLVAASGGNVVGVVSIGRAGEEEDNAGELFGLWVTPSERGSGVAWHLVQAGAEQARADGRSHLAYWVGTENGAAVAFASSFGFRPTDTRRPMRVTSEEDGEEEIAMVLPLTDDRTWVPASGRR